MNSLLEQMRALHEERDRIEMAVVEEMLAKKTGYRDRLDSEHRQKLLVDRYMKCSARLKELYERKDVEQTTFSHFYAALKQIREFYGGEQVAVPVNDLDGAAPVVSKAEEPIDFTDEESHGRYLDLTQCHEAFLQVLKYEETKPKYLNFLNNFDRLTDLDRDKKMTSAYKNYVQKMLEYFRDFSRRAKPLFDYKDFESQVEDEFEKQWKDRTFPGWFTDADRSEPVGIQMIDLSMYRSHEELMGLGLDCLKKELQARGLKCGGTLEERAMRLWSIHDKKPQEVDDSLKSGPAVNKKLKKKSGIEPYTIAAVEAKLAKYAEYYSDTRLATIENVQRKQARTAEERNESDDDLSNVEDDDDDNDDHDDVVYNPKNLPLGWDGKPIPYWLYKLHGLNLTYTCEICGNTTYKGPKAFERHFSERRHAHGMECLGIPNTAHFANMTKIQDAIKLWEKLKSERQKDRFQPAYEEEFEDSQGNVVNRKTYEDLKRQGLL